MGLLQLLRKPGSGGKVVKGQAAVACGAAGVGTAARSDGTGSVDRSSFTSDGSTDLNSPVLAPAAAPPRSSAGSGRRRGALDVMGAAAAPTTDRHRLPPVPPAASERRRGVCSGDPRSAEVDALFCEVVLIHRGRNALVYRARERESRRPVVLKYYDPRRSAALDRELRLLRDVGQHPGVIQLESVLEAGGSSHVVLEACSGGTLIEAIANSGGHLAERVAARRIVLPLLRALEHLHGRGIVHRDLKPEHILLTPDGLRIADFSSAAYLPTKRQQQQQQQQQHGPDGKEGAPPVRQRRVSTGGLGTELLNHRLATTAIEYMAPEMLSKPTAAEVFHLVLALGMDEEELPTYDEKVDVWSVGAIIFEAVTGFQPFLADGVAEMASVVAQKMEARDAESGLPAFLARQSAISPECKDFVARCLEPKPGDRPTAAELLAHPWVARRASMSLEAAAGGGQAAVAAHRTFAGAAGLGSFMESQGSDSSSGGLAAVLAPEVSAAAAAASALLVQPCHAATAGGPMRRISTAAGGGGSPRRSLETPLHRSASAADTRAGLHLTTRSHTSRLEGSRPGTRAVSAAQLAGNN